MIKRILVCAKLVPGTTEVEMDGQFRLKRDNANLQLNIADLSAVECALRLKAEQPDGEVTVLSMGPAKAEQTLKELFALGVDRVVLLCDRVLAGADSLATAAALTAAVNNLGGFDCILCGRRAMDAETGQIPGQLAAALAYAAVTNVQSLELSGDGILCSRQLENGTACVQTAMPCVISLCEYGYALRLPSILGRRRAKDKQVEFMTAADVGLAPESCGLAGSKTKVVHVDTKAPGLRKCRFLNLESLAAQLQEVTG